MSTVTLEDAKEVTKKLVSNLPLKAVIVFGSVAREGKGNDLDLLVVREETNKSKKEYYDEVGKLLEEFFERFSIDYFVAPQSVIRQIFLDGGPFLRLIQREGKSLYMKDSIKDWLYQAKDDLESAEILFKAEHYRGACIHAQQALEKAMKGLLLDSGWVLEKTHNLRSLRHYGNLRQLNYNLSDEAIDMLDSFYEARYPGEEGVLPTGEPTKEQTKFLLSEAQSFFKFHSF